MSFCISAGVDGFRNDGHSAHLNGPAAYDVEHMVGMDVGGRKGYFDNGSEHGVGCWKGRASKRDGYTELEVRGACRIKPVYMCTDNTVLRRVLEITVWSTDNKCSGCERCHSRLCYRLSKSTINLIHPLKVSLGAV